MFTPLSIDYALYKIEASGSVGLKVLAATVNYIFYLQCMLCKNVIFLYVGFVGSIAQMIHGFKQLITGLVHIKPYIHLLERCMCLMLLVEHCLPSSTLSMGNMASELSETVSSHIVILSKGWLSQRQSMATLRISKGAVHGSHHQKINTSSFVYWRPEKLLHLKYTINMINKTGRQSAKVLLKKEKGFTDKSRQRLEIGCQILQSPCCHSNKRAANTWQILQSNILYSI